MRLIIASLVLITILSSTLTAQELNKEFIKGGQQPYLIGKINKQGLQSKTYANWFVPKYNSYKPNEKTVDALRPSLKNYDIVLFMATWCGDSKTNVPKLLKVLDGVKFPQNQLKIIAVSRESSSYKQSPEHEETGLNIHRVPTIIVYKNGIEVNRIVEHPIQSLEDDLYNIINGNNYKSNYQIVTAIDRLLLLEGVPGLKSNFKSLIQNYKEQVTSMHELNTYARVLYSKNKKEEAIAVFEMNTELFPNDPRTYLSYANILALNGSEHIGIAVLEKAAGQFPENSDLKEQLSILKNN